MRTLPELQFESSYIEDGVLNVLVSPAESDDDRRFTIEADPVSRRIKNVFTCHSTDEGIFEMNFSPNEDDLEAFREIVQNCRIDADDGSAAIRVPK